MLLAVIPLTPLFPHFSVVFPSSSSFLGRVSASPSPSHLLLSLHPSSPLFISRGLGEGFCLVGLFVMGEVQLRAAPLSTTSVKCVSKYISHALSLGSLLGQRVSWLFSLLPAMSGSVEYSLTPPTTHSGIFIQTQI